MPFIHCKQPLQIGYLDTPIGELLIQGCYQGLHLIKRSPNNILVDSDVNLLKRSDVMLKNQIDYEPIKDACNWFKLYFEDPNKCSSIKTPNFCSFNEYSEFYKNVWTALKELTKPGDQISYKGLSQLAVGNSKSSRAVGTAMRNNPFPIIIPCHRVIKSNGDHGNYSGGKNIKPLLLSFEDNFKTTSK